MVTNLELAETFGELAALTRVADGNNHSFRARAYDAAARIVEGLASPAAGMTESQLRELDGVGGAVAARIREYAESGKIAKLEELRAEFPPEFVELTRIPGLGPKTALMLRERLGVASVADLEEALAGERLRDLPGLGAKTEENLRNAVRRLGLSGKERRTPIMEAQRQARRLAEAVRAAPGVERAMVCGSLRRFRETVADLDILAAVSADGPEGRRGLEEALAKAAPVREVAAAGETKTTLITHSALQVDVRAVRPDQWGSAALHFTGSKEHNVRLRRLAIERGWVLNEYALAEAESGRVVASETEEEVYAALGLPWIPPELREDRGEIEAGQAGGLPELVGAGDLRGDLHVHTDLSGDGEDSLEAMAAAAAERGLEYVAITDHAENLAINGADRGQMLAQRERIRELQEEYPRMRILHGTELNIAPDGSLDYDFDFLMGYDWCVASVHSHFDLPAARQTERLLAAVRHPAVNVIGHPTGRRIGRRPGIEFDAEAVLAAAEETGVALEINSNLDRLDAPAELLWEARGRDVLFVISTDAHRVSELDQVKWGIRQSRRGWVPKKQVANTRPADQFLEWAAAVRRI